MGMVCWWHIVGWKVFLLIVIHISWCSVEVVVLYASRCVGYNIEFVWSTPCIVTLVDCVVRSTAHCCVSGWDLIGSWGARVPLVLPLCLCRLAGEWSVGCEILVAWTASTEIVWLCACGCRIVGIFWWGWQCGYFLHCRWFGNVPCASWLYVDVFERWMSDSVWCLRQYWLPISWFQMVGTWVVVTTALVPWGICGTEAEWIEGFWGPFVVCWLLGLACFVRMLVVMRQCRESWWVLLKRCSLVVCLWVPETKQFEKWC